MGNVRCRPRPAPLYDHIGLARHLEAMAARGWLLEKTAPVFWRYRRARPQRLRYAVVYDEDGGDGAGLREAYLAAGWTPVSVRARIGVFMTAQEDPAPVEGEPEKLRRIRAELGRSLFRVHLPLAALLLIFLGVLVYGFVCDPVEALAALSGCFV